MSRFTKYFARNNIKSTLFLAISQNATSIQVQSGEGERFGTDFPFYATLEAVDSGKVIKREIIKATARSGDILTVERAVAPCPASDDDNTQGQTAFEFNAGDSISIYITADIVNSIQTSINDLYDNGNDRLYVHGTGGLNISVNGGNVRFNNAEHYYNGGTATLTDNATNYVMLDGRDNIVVSTESFDTAKISLAEIITASGNIVSITPRKIDSRTGELGGGGSYLYGDGSDGEMTISENTVLNAGYQYQFTNLTICPGVVVSFTGQGGGRIKVNNTFINCGTIQMTDLNIKPGCYVEKDFGFMLKNCAGFEFIPGRGGKGGSYWTCCCGSIIGDKATSVGGNGGDAINSISTCVGSGGAKGVFVNGGSCVCRRGKDGGEGHNRGGGGGGASAPGNAQCTGNIFNGSNGAGNNGGSGGSVTCAISCLSMSHGGGGGGGYYDGRGGDGGYSLGPSGIGGDGGNGGILGNGGNGGNSCTNGGNGGDGVCGGNGGNGGQYGGNGGNGFYGGNGGNGCTYGGGNGGDGVVPGQGGNVCAPYYLSTYCDYGKGGNGKSALHSLEIKACNFCNCGYICSEGAVGGKGGCVLCTAASLNQIGFQGGCGGQGGNILIAMNCELARGFITVEGGQGGQRGGKSNFKHGKRGLPGCLIYLTGCN